MYSLWSIHTVETPPALIGCWWSGGVVQSVAVPAWSQPSPEPVCQQLQLLIYLGITTLTSKERGPLLSFTGINLHHGRQKKPYKVTPLSIQHYLCLVRSGLWIWMRQGSCQLFSLGMSWLARIVQSLWRLLAPCNQSLIRQRDFFLRKRLAVPQTLSCRDCTVWRINIEIYNI